METKQKKTKLVAALLALAGLLVFSLFAVGGSLEPSGPPGPTMKTLDEVEPRIPISQSDIPLTISTPGSYYFTEEVTAAVTAITVDVDDVTIDLAGFALVGPDSGTNYGIRMFSRSNVEIRNGTVRDFQYGIYENGSSGQDHRVIDVRATSNTQSGIFLFGKNHLVKNCTATDNGAGAASTIYGIRTDSGSTVTSNTVSGNGASATGSVRGIYTTNGCTITDNTVCDNGAFATGGTVHGIYASGNGCTVTDNTVTENGVSAIGSTVYGISVNYGCTVAGNSSYRNGYNATTSTVYGIRAYTGSTVTGNTAYNNGDNAGTVYGIYANTGSTVTGNSAYDNGSSASSNVYGIRAYTGSTVTGNTAYNNGDNAGTVYGICLSGYNLVDQNTAYSNGTGAVSATDLTLGLAGCVYGINVGS